MAKESGKMLASGWVYVAVALLMAVMAGQIVHAIKGESLTWDEGDHIFAGYEGWKTHDYGLNPEHPPMVKMLATIPLLGLDLKAPKLQGRFFKTEAYLDGQQLLFHNGAKDGGRYDSQTLVLRVRLAAMLITMIAAVLVFCAGKEMFGTGAGLVGLGLFCFEPNLLAHGAYVTTDMAASCTIFATVYAFWRWTARRTWGRLLVVGVAAGLALAAKHSGLLVAPMLVLLAAGQVVMDWRGRREKAGADVGKMVGALGAVVVVGVAVLWAFYGFRYAARPSPLVLAPSLTDYVGPLAGMEGHGILLAARLHLLPESWLYGLADVRAMANGMPSYFFGKVYAHGVWFYFPVLFTIKSTLGMLGLLALTVVATVRRWLRGRELWFLVAPPSLYLAVAMDSHLNIGARHILPVWVFCCVLAGGGVGVLVQRGRGWAVAAGVLVALHVGSSVAAAPNYISYSNEAWGGPTQTYRYLTDSNTDWAQELVATAGYVKTRGIKQCWMAYFAAPLILPEDYGIPCRRLPSADSLGTPDALDVLEVPETIEGPVLISAGTLNGFEFGSKVLNPYESFRGVKPTAFIQNGIFVYDGSFHVPLAAAEAYVQRSGLLLKAGDLEGALREAKEGVRIAPGAVATEIAMGDAEKAAGDKAAAKAAYAAAQRTVDTMEEGAKAIWTETLRGKVMGL